MDIYGFSAPDSFRIDDLLDFSNEDLFSATTDGSSSPFSLAPLENPAAPSISPATNRTSTFPDALCVPSDDIAELEWLSRFVDDSFSDFPSSDLDFPAENANYTAQDVQSVSVKARRKRTRATAAAARAHTNWPSSPEPDMSIKKRESLSPSSIAVGTGVGQEASSASSSSSSSSGRKCTHCASEKTPQWRSGPLGPKTLCNACGVRYKSGRLVPEYRPAASPTFVLTQHSNSHRKVMELRRQKEILRQENNRRQHELFHPDFEVC